MPKSQNIKRYEDVITLWDRASRASLWDRCSTWLSTFQNFWIFKIIKYFLRVISGCAYETFSSIFVQMELQSSTTAVEWETKTEKCVAGLQWLLVVKWSACSRFTPTIRVQILLTPTLFICLIRKMGEVVVGGQVVIMLTLYSNDPSSNPAEACIFQHIWF